VEKKKRFVEGRLVRTDTLYAKAVFKKLGYGSKGVNVHSVEKTLSE